jgi:hypothetical protein
LDLVLEPILIGRIVRGPKRGCAAVPVHPKQSDICKEKEAPMKSTQGIAALALVAFLAASGGAFAETPTSPPPTAVKSTDTATTDKAAISKACSQQADAKGLKSKPRKHFRSKCKKNGGKGE